MPRWVKIAGFFHEIVMMNYAGRLLSKEFLAYAYALCRNHDVPTVCDEIQSCIWHHDSFTFRERDLTPSCVAIGKGFPGALNRRGLDISVQTYMADCRPAVLTKLPLLATPAVVDFVLGRFEQVIQAL